MKSHADFFRGRLIASFGLERIDSIKLAQWIDSRSASLSSSARPGYPLTLQSLLPLRPIFTYEASRFASAALESYGIAKVKWKDPEDRDGLGWRLVGLYYASYYSAHAILRMAGVSITQIDSWKAVETEFKNLYSTPAIESLDLETGYHALILDPTGNSISVSKLKLDSKHGSHAAVWKEFKKLADTSYANNALNTSQHQEAIRAYSQKLNSPAIIDNSSCNWPWMPSVRNQINYRLPIEVWGPLAKRLRPSENKQIHSLIVSPSTNQIIDGSCSGSLYLRFSASCVYLVSLLCHLLRDMEIRSKSNHLLPTVFKERSTLISKLASA